MTHKLIQSIVSFLTVSNDPQAKVLLIEVQKEVDTINAKYLDLFYNALCNYLGYMAEYGLEFRYNEKEYKEAAKKLNDPCYEDVLIQMLKDGYKLSFKDIEGEGDQDSEITLQDVYDRMPLVPANHLADMENENDDGSTADAILQTVFFKEIVFG